MDIHSDRLSNSSDASPRTDELAGLPGSHSQSMPHAVTGVSRASTQVATTRESTVPASPLRSSSESLTSGLFWLLATLMLILAAWFLGPLAIEKYQYAATKGRIAAEYENAGEMLAEMPLRDVSLAFQLVAQKIKPSVVSVRAEGEVSRRGRTSGGQGSGVIMSDDGYILTNNHVISGARRVIIGLDDRRQFEGTVVGTDNRSDLAVIKIDAVGLFPAEFGNSDQLNVGSMVWAVGSPYGLEQTVTSGILSAKERGSSDETNVEYLQTDAAVNPGNSGGPLVNARGKVVGINTSIYGDQFQGISFAVPSSTAEFVFNEIIEHGKVKRSYLGIDPNPVTHNDMRRLGLPDLNGALIADIPNNGPAAYSDLRVGDVIRNWGGNEIRTYNMLFRYIGMSPPHTLVDVDIIREGKPIRLQLTTIPRPASIDM